MESLPAELLSSILSECDPQTLHTLCIASTGSALSVAARRREPWELHLNAVGIRPDPGRDARAQYLEWREGVFGPRSRLGACERGELPFLRELGIPHAITELPPLLSFGLVVDIVKLCAQSQPQALDGSRYRAAAEWIARRAKSADVDERRLAAALREAYHRCFPPSPATVARRPRKPPRDAEADDGDQPDERDALAELLSRPAVRTACDTFGRYHVGKLSEEKWLRCHTTTF